MADEDFGHLGSSLNDGNQYIGWKYYTPLKGDYLNTILGEVVTPGLITRPKINVTNITDNICRFSVQPFSCFVIPSDDPYYEDPITNPHPTRLIKITTTAPSSLWSLTEEDVAIGFGYSLTNGQQASRNWYGSFQKLTAAEVENYRGIIIASVQLIKKEISGVMCYGYSITTAGADISNILLEKEGWNPECWLSLISPRRAYASGGPGKINCLEIRRYNDNYTEYMAGKAGLVKFNNSTTRWTLPTPTAKDNEGIRGYMDKNYTVFGFNTNKNLFKSKENDTMTLSNYTNIDGGIIGLVDATVNNSHKADEDAADNLYLAAANKLTISPIKQENQNVSWFDSTTKTLYIK